MQQSDLNTRLTIWAILPTLFDSRKAHHNEVLQAIKYKHGGQVYQEPSKETTKYNDALVLKADVGMLDKALGLYWDRLAGKLIEGSKN